MKTHRLFYIVAPVMMLATILLLQGVIATDPELYPSRGGSHTNFSVAAMESRATRGHLDLGNTPARDLGLLATGTLTFTEHIITNDFDGAYSVHAADVDSDGDVDVLGAAYWADEIAWWKNDGNESFTKHVITYTFGFASCVYAADIDGDGDMDILGTSELEDSLIWWENDGNENFTGHTITDTFMMPYSVYAADLDSDGDVDILGAAYAADDIAWWENNGSENFTGHIITDTFDGAHSVYATDLDGDGDMDILGSAFTADDIAWWENDGSESFTGRIIDSDFRGAQSVYATDLDGDENVDILAAAYNAGNIAWWRNNGNKSFTKYTIAGNFSHASAAYATDMDGDDDADVLGAAITADDITWWENNGSASFTEHIVAGNFDGAHSVYAADVNSDGAVDILGAAYDAGDITWWEQKPSLSIGDASVTEGNNGSVGAVFSVTLSMTSTQAITVEYATADGSATAPADYTAIPTTTLVFAPGVSTRLITVSVQGDAIDEMDEIFWVNLANPVNADLGDGQGQGVILDDDGFVIYLPLILRNAGPPLPPVLNGISNLDGKGNYAVSWSAVGGATSYTLEEDDSDTFTSPTVVYSGSGTSKSFTGRNVGKYYYRVKALNSFGSSDWSNIESVTVTVPPPACAVSCSTPSGYCSGSWSVSLSCESGSYNQTKNCYYCQVGGVIGTCCDVTRTYSGSGRTYSMSARYYNCYVGYSHCCFSVSVWGGVFGSDIQTCNH